MTQPPFLELVIYTSNNADLLKQVAVCLPRQECDLL